MMSGYTSIIAFTSVVTTTCKKAVSVDKHRRLHFCPLNRSSPYLLATSLNSIWNCSKSGLPLSTNNPLFINLNVTCVMQLMLVTHGSICINALTSTRMGLPLRIFLCAQWSYEEFYHIKEVQEQVWLSHLWNVFNYWTEAKSQCTVGLNSCKSVLISFYLCNYVIFACSK